jgi:hypothetical protein
MSVSTYAERPALAVSCLMHRSITACSRKAMLNGGNRPELVTRRNDCLED